MKKQILLFVTIAVAMLSSCEKEIITSPLASFNYEQETEFIPEAADNGYFVGFTNTSSDAETYLWDLGDGDTKATTAMYFDYEYNEPGSYLVQLTATDAAGNSDLTEQTIIVTGTNINVTCFYAGTEIQCYDYAATIFEDYDDFINDEFQLNKIISNEDGIVSFRNLIAGKKYYVRIFSSAVSGAGYYDNLNSVYEITPEIDQVNIFITFLDFY